MTLEKFKNMIYQIDTDFDDFEVIFSCKCLRQTVIDDYGFDSKEKLIEFQGEKYE